MEWEEVIERAKAYVREVFAEDASGHDAYHTLRVCELALRLAKEEGADPTLTALAALLHDVDDEKLFPEGAKEKKRARAFMEEAGIEGKMQEAVCRIIGEVSFRGTDSVVPSTLEGRVVQDADRLDAMGAIGIARAFAYGGSRGNALHDPELPPSLGMDEGEYRRHRGTTVNHFYEKLLLLQGMLTTPSGRRMGRTRDAYMREFLERFLAEWEGRT